MLNLVDFAYGTLWLGKPRHVALNQEGLALLQAGMYGSAIEAFTRVLHMKPDYAPAYTNRGTALKRLGELDRALADYNAALRLDPDSVAALGHRGLLQIGRAHV